MAAMLSEAEEAAISSIEDLLQPVEPLLLHVVAREAMEQEAPLGPVRVAGNVIAEVFVNPTSTVHQLRKAFMQKAQEAGIEHLAALTRQGVTLPEHLTLRDAGVNHLAEVETSAVTEVAVASASADGDIRIWDAKQGACLDTLKAHTEPILCTSFSPSGALLATGSADATAKLWDTATKETTKVLVGHEDWVNSIAFSRDGANVVTASMDSSARLWDVELGLPLNSFHGQVGPVFAAELAPDARSVAVCGAPTSTDVSIFDVRSGECIRILRGGSTDDGHLDDVLCCRFAADGRSLLTGSQDKTAKLWDVGQNMVSTTYSGHSDSVSSVNFTPDDAQLLTGSHDRSIKVWDTGTMKCLRTLQGHAGSVISAQVAPDSQTLLSGSRDSTVRLWDFKTGKCLQVMQGHKMKVNAVAYVPF